MSGGPVASDTVPGAARTLREVIAWATRPITPAGPPESGWASFLTVAHANGLLSAVAAALDEDGWPITTDLYPGERTPLGVLATARDQVRARQADLRQHLDLVVGTLARSGVRAVPIKGGHLLAAWPTTDLSERSMVDVDVVIDPADAGAAHRALIEAGYRDADPDADADLATHQLSPMVHARLSGSVELHVAVARFQTALGPAELLDRARPGVPGGPLVPSDDHAAVILVAHAMLHDRSLWMLDRPGRALVDLVLFDRLGLQPDWEAVRSRFHRSGSLGRVAFEAFLASAHASVPVSLPAPEPVGRAWFRLAEQAAAHPGAHARWREAVCLRQSFRPERMRHLYGANNPHQVRVARARHIAHGVSSRVPRLVTGERLPGGDSDPRLSHWWRGAVVCGLGGSVAQESAR